MALVSLNNLGVGTELLQKPCEVSSVCLSPFIPIYLWILKSELWTVITSYIDYFHRLYIDIFLTKTTFLGRTYIAPLLMKSAISRKLLSYHCWFSQPGGVRSHNTESLMLNAEGKGSSLSYGATLYKLYWRCYLWYSMKSKKNFDYLGSVFLYLMWIHINSHLNI